MSPSQAANGDEFALELSQRLQSAWLGRTHRHLTRVASTNDEAAAWARQGAPHGAMVSTDEQTHGRGRLGRVWSNAVGQDLCVSLILRPTTAQHLGALGLAVAVGLREGLVEVLPPPLRGQLGLKWPNDVLFAGRKVAGILCECRWADKGPEVVVGFGINVHHRSFSPDLVDRATTIEDALAGRGQTSRVEVLAAVLFALEDALEAFWPGGFPAIRQRYEPFCREIGQAVRLVESTAQGLTERWCHAWGLDHDGALLVGEVGSPVRTRVQSADVWLAHESGEGRR